MFNNRAIRVALYVWACSLITLVSIAVIARIIG